VRACVCVRVRVCKRVCACAGPSRAHPCMLKYETAFPWTVAGLAEMLLSATAVTVPGEVRLVQDYVCVTARVCACLTVRV
jgi:hypothetical protein